MSDNLPPLPTPEGFRTRYRSDPGMLGNYPWAYEDKRRKGERPEHESEDLFTTAQMQAYARAAIEASRAAVPADRCEELEILAARWAHLEYMYSRGAAPDTIAHYIGRPERLDFSARLHREHGGVAAPQQVAQPSEPYAWIRPNGINHSGVAHIGKTRPPGWPGATAVYTRPVAHAKPEQAAQPNELVRYGGRCEKHLRPKPCPQCLVDHTSQVFAERVISAAFPNPKD